MRREGSARHRDVAVNEAYDGLGATYDLFWEVWGRGSIDDEGIPLDATVHFGRDYDNAFWDGTQMVFGDGDGELFNRHAQINAGLFGLKKLFGGIAFDVDLLMISRGGGMLADRKRTRTRNETCIRLPA